MSFEQTLDLVRKLAEGKLKRDPEAKKRVKPKYVEKPNSAARGQQA